MKSPNRSLLAAAALVAAFVLPLQTIAALPQQPLAEQAKTLPVTTSVSQGEPGPQFGAPYVLSVTNTSKAELKIGAVVAQSVVGHNRPKNIEHPDKTLQAGETWKLDDLAAGDKVTLRAPGYAPVEVTIEPSR